METIHYFSLVLFFALLQFAQAQPVPQDSTDLVWSLKTDQSAGFYMVKFSNTDSLIVGHGYDYDLFFDAKTGQEIQRILGNKEIFFINNDNNFIRRNQQATKNKILKTKWFPKEENLQKFNIYNIKFLCDNRIIATHYKEYKNPSNPNNPIRKIYHSIFDFNSLDSIDVYKEMVYFELSNNCIKIAFNTGDPNYGVEVYDFNTKEFLWKLPINGPSLTGIEFSPDDKYLVTSNGPGTNALKIWSIEIGNETYDYGIGSRDCIDVSHDGEFIVSSSASRLTLREAKFGINTVPGDSGITPQIIYPNPTTGIATIQYQQPFSENTNMYITGINGQIVKPILNNYLEEGIKTIDFNTQDISNGIYFVKVENTHLSLVFKLIVNKEGDKK